MTVKTMVEKLDNNKVNNKPCPEVISVLIGNHCYDYKNFDKLARTFGEKKIKGMYAESLKELIIQL